MATGWECGLLEPNADSSTRVEQFKEMQRPGRSVGKTARSLFQMNAGVDLDRVVPVVRVAPRFEGMEARYARKKFPNDLRKAILTAFQEVHQTPQGLKHGIFNADLDAYVTMSQRDMDAHLKIDNVSKFQGLEALEAMAARPHLMHNAVLVETHEDTHKNPDVRKVHRLYAPLAIGVKVYTVKLTVKEYRDGLFSVDLPEPMRLYHHRLEKNIPCYRKGFDGLIRRRA